MLDLPVLLHYLHLLLALARLLPVINCSHYFSFLFGELKGPNGSAGKARLQNVTACFISLSIHFRLARLARAADPQNYRRPSDTMHKVYGLLTGSGGGVWTLAVLAATTEWTERQPEAIAGEARTNADSATPSSAGVMEGEGAGGSAAGDELKITSCVSFRPDIHTLYHEAVPSRLADSCIISRT